MCGLPHASLDGGRPAPHRPVRTAPPGSAAPQCQKGALDKTIEPTRTPGRHTYNLEPRTRMPRHKGWCGLPPSWQARTRGYGKAADKMSTWFPRAPTLRPTYRVRTKRSAHAKEHRTPACRQRRLLVPAVENGGPPEVVSTLKSGGKSCTRSGVLCSFVRCCDAVGRTVSR